MIKKLLLLILVWTSVSINLSHSKERKVSTRVTPKITSQSEAQLPPEPGPDKDKTVEGIDANKNHVRDDVERYIYYGLLKKDPKIYKAYFNVTESWSLVFKNRLDRDQLLPLLSRHDNDTLCVKAVDRADDPEISLDLLRKKFHDIKLRREASNQVGSTVFSRSPRGKGPKEEKWGSLCRN